VLFEFVEQLTPERGRERLGIEESKSDDARIKQTFQTLAPRSDQRMSVLNRIEASRSRMRQHRSKSRVDSALTRLPSKQARLGRSEPPVRINPVDNDIDHQLQFVRARFVGEHCRSFVRTVLKAERGMRAVGVPREEDIAGLAGRKNWRRENVVERHVAAAFEQAPPPVERSDDGRMDIVNLLREPRGALPRLL